MEITNDVRDFISPGCDTSLCGETAKTRRRDGTKNSHCISLRLRALAHWTMSQKGLK
jgi:hypothetical protein